MSTDITKLLLEIVQLKAKVIELKSAVRAHEAVMETLYPDIGILYSAYSVQNVVTPDSEKFKALGRLRYAIESYRATSAGMHVPTIDIVIGKAFVTRNAQIVDQRRQQEQKVQQEQKEHILVERPDNLQMPDQYNVQNHIPPPIILPESTIALEPIEPIDYGVIDISDDPDPKRQRISD